VLVLGGALLAVKLQHGWFPHDDGALGQSAERVLLGEVPHRDFDEIYTGLLSYVNALAFRAVGISSVALRLPLFIAALLWQAALYRLALRFAPQLGATLITLLALAWSVPNYPAAMPSWYNLFCATWGLVALARWHEDGRSRWLLLAGAAGGVSFLFKLSGVFFIVGGALALTSASCSRPPRPPQPTLRYAQAAVAVALLAVLVPLWRLVAPTGLREFTRFVVPIGLLVLALVVQEYRGAGGSARERLVALQSALVPFLLGAAVPVALFFACFAAAGGLDDLIRGVFVTPFRRLAFAAGPPPSPVALLWSLPLAWFLWPRTDPRSTKWYWWGAVVSLVLVLMLVLSGTSAIHYVSVWWSAWALPFVVGVLGALIVAARDRWTGLVGAARRDMLITFCTVAAFFTLIEFPFAASVYTLYTLPLAILAASAVVRAVGKTPALLQCTMLLFYLVFAVFRVNPNSTVALGREFVPSSETVQLGLPRGGINVSPQHAATYGTLIPLIQEVSVGRTLWAGPDAPEVYFLSGIANQTRTMFDFFDATSRHASLAAHLDSLDISLVVLNRAPGFSAAPGPATEAGLAAYYPHRRSIGGFLVLWR
jgi:hypothetical protein